MKKYELRLSSAMVIAGSVVRAGTCVMLDEPTAKDFLRRGKAELVATPVDEHHPGDSTDIRRMNKAELLEHAGTLGVKVNEELTKAQIIAAIEGSNG